MNAIPKWIIGIALTLILFLSWQNRALLAERRALLTKSTTPAIGLWFRHESAKSPAGENNESGYVYAFLDPRCVYCDASLPTLEKIRSAISRRHGVKFKFVALSKIPYLRSSAPGFPIEVTSDPAVSGFLTAYGTPLIIATDSEGTIRYAKPGLISNMDDAKDLMAALTLMERGIAPQNLNGGGL